MDKKGLILIGGGGHCKSCIDVVESEGKYKIRGIIEAENKLNIKVFEYNVIGCDHNLPELVNKKNCFLIAIGNIKSADKRVEKFNYLITLGAVFPKIISPLAHLAKGVTLGEGSIVMHRALINSNASVGKNCIINTFALIEHDSTIGDHCHISTASIVNGTCVIGNRVFIGSNSVIVNDVNIADDVIIGAGSVVKKSINQPGLYVGNPARRIESNN